MIEQQLDERIADVLHEQLVGHVAGHRRRRRRRAVTRVVVVVAAVAAVGGCVAYASSPPTVVPRPLARPVIVSGVGSTVVPLPPAPRDATNIEIMLSCMSPGRCMTPGGGTASADSWEPWAEFGPLADPDSLRLTNEPDEGNAQRLPPIDPADGLPISAGPRVVWRVWVAYVGNWNSEQGTNDAGQTYGLPNATGEPDLIAVWTDDGQLGYTPSALLLGADSSPRLWSEGDLDAYLATSHEAAQTLPVYTEDGETLIGTLTIK